MWGKLSLRVQAAIAVLLPCVAVAVFTSFYFPQRLNEQAGQALERQARSIGLLAVANAAPTMRLIRDGLANPDELDSVFAGVRAGGNIDHVGALVVSPETAITEGTRKFVVIKPDSKVPVQVRGDLPPGRYEVPTEGRCEVARGTALWVRCAAKDQDYTALIVAEISLAELSDAERKNQTVGIWVLLMTVVGGLALAFFFSGALAGPIGMVTRMARTVAGGDVSIEQLRVTGSGEVTSMADSVNEMLANLKTLVKQMVSLTDRLGGAAQGLIAASNDQDHITSQQSAYAQEIAATFEELSRTAEMIQGSTDTVEQAAVRTSGAVDEARAVVNEMVGGITEIRRESKEVAEAIGRLNQDLQQVSRIAQVIKQVADRSDLLALNAALEGTKAGEVGRGFSLVAAEMRKLAENVAVSARDIGRLVENVQASGDQAVAKAREGVGASDRGVAVAEKASAVFQQIVELSRGTKEAAQQIAIATRQQKQSSEQAVQGARNVADLVKQGVDATSRSTKIAHDLKSAVAALSDVTKRFKAERS
jgi:methyl-accepting chemotaxis protein